MSAGPVGTDREVTGRDVARALSKHANTLDNLAADERRDAVACGIAAAWWRGRPGVVHVHVEPCGPWTLVRLGTGIYSGAGWGPGKAAYVAAALNVATAARGAWRVY